MTQSREYLWSLRIRRRARTLGTHEIRIDCELVWRVLSDL